MSNAIDPMLAYHQATGHYPGALVLIEADGRTLCRRESGRLHGHDEADATRLTSTARFRVASLTKPMVSAVVMMQIERGKLRLDMPLAEVLPELADRRLAGGRAPVVQPTLLHLLTHTAGLPYAPEIRDPAVRRQALDAGLGDIASMTRSGFLGAIAGLPLQAEPGTRFQYGYSTDLLGLILERVIGARMSDLMRSHLFEPLAMRASSFRADPARHAAMPTAFTADQAWHRFNGQFESVERVLSQRQGEPGGLDGPLESAGGGLISTLDDVAAFARLIANGGRIAGRALLSEDSVALMVQDHLGPGVDGPGGFIGGGWGFGLGGAVRLDVGAAAVPSAPGEFSWSGVTGQSLFIDPARRWFALMLSANTASRVMVRFEFRRAAAH